MPKTPHSSRGPSRWSVTGGRMPSLPPRLAAALDPSGQTALPDRPQLGDPNVEQTVDAQNLATDLADHDEAGQGLARAGHDEPPAGRLPERIQTRRQPNRRADCPRDAALGKRDRDTALGDVVRAVERPRPDARSDRLVSDPDRPGLNRRQLPDR